MEEWKDIKGYDGYQVSNFGNVRTHNKKTHTERHGVRHWKDRVLRPKGEVYATGYRVDLWKNGKPHTFLIARLVAFTFFEEDIENHYLTVNHIDGNRFNNQIENLEIIPLKDNITHGFATGLYSACKKTEVTDKLSGTKTTFLSMSQASRFIGHSQSYISTSISEGKYENNEFRWCLV